MDTLEFAERQSELASSLAAAIDIAASRLQPGESIGPYTVMAACHGRTEDGEPWHSARLAPSSPDSRIATLTLTSGYADVLERSAEIEYRVQPVDPAKVRAGWLGRLAVRLLRPATRMTETFTYIGSEGAGWHYTDYEQVEEFFVRGVPIGRHTTLLMQNDEVITREAGIGGIGNVNIVGEVARIKR